MEGHLSDWSDFFVAMAGGAAALAGLLFVSISINVTRIAADPALPGRAQETISLLIGALAVAGVALMPGQSTRVLGVTIGIVAVASCVVTNRFHLRVTRNDHDRPARQRTMRTILTESATVPAIVGSLLLLADVEAGLYVIGAGILIAFAVAVINAWVLLIEILR